MSSYNVGDRVDRIEDREVTAATIISVQESQDENLETLVELQYDEGGSGWWPISAIKTLVAHE